MSEPKEYEIKTVKDFLKVPAEMLPACLSEFLHYLYHMELYKDLFDTNVIIPAFIWIDDGKITTTEEIMYATRGELLKVLEQTKEQIKTKGQDNE